ncbi:hypothetical protein H351_30230 (plasmid) [Rhodococcus erythropolis R138]|uniref:FUSC family protein n=1 Tax=Rhodococcus erythropolis TaxID=1833 RepID=UPI0004924BFD|nr:FUSC family protein [Rhodococcus erythropolis]ALU73681.1 hypothetical protein H351_30230 [Rhodococcus erythropolis R138]
MVDVQAFGVSRKSVMTAAGLVLTAVIVIGSIAFVGGPHFANAAYLGMMFLVPAIRRLSRRQQLLAALWASAVSFLGVQMAGSDRWLILVVLIGVCLVQGAFASGSVAAISGSPVNFVVFSGFEPGSSPWQAAAGTLLGSLLVVAAAYIARLPPTRHALPARQAFEYGVLLALGCVVIVGVMDLLDLPRVTWALLAFCLIFVPDPHEHPGQISERILGTAIGAVAVTALASFLPTPLVVVLLLVCAILTLAYLEDDKRLLYISLLTPTVILMASLSGSSRVVDLGAQRVVAVLVAGAVAVVLYFVLGNYHKWLHRDHTRTER